jgi:hypothetical protein
MEFDDSQWVLGAWWGTIDDCELFEQGWWGARMDGVSGGVVWEAWLDWGICDGMCWLARGRNGRNGRK